MPRFRCRNAESNPPNQECKGVDVILCLSDEHFVSASWAGSDQGVVTRGPLLLQGWWLQSSLVKSGVQRFGMLKLGRLYRAPHLSVLLHAGCHRSPSRPVERQRIRHTWCCWARSTAAVARIQRRRPIKPASRYAPMPWRACWLSASRPLRPIRARWRTMRSRCSCGCRCWLLAGVVVSLQLLSMRAALIEARSLCFRRC
ncbi:uncharacterized protein BJ171DRAFT_17319 [Polychytrium aggregatum]|uniref:uncharacterized protein n=1 Tax=Polychytrium aggregatum TaxID=110093 RepID=UPI0022FF302A|nr:uncharacterized protein BJ171DRAFT_17319 [Polychytrium aggregatum]KAI9206684.1 hypothetical protein BJ171DRAFT_17319 [Polychytrium aggregatum]